MKVMKLESGRWTCEGRINGKYIYVEGYTQKGVMRRWIAHAKFFLGMRV